MKNKLQCTVTGEWYGVSKTRREKLITKFGGSEEALIKGFVSRDAKRLLAAGKTADEIRAMAAKGELASKTRAPKAPKTAATGVGKAV